MDFSEIAHALSFGYHRPHLAEGGVEAGWNLISQKNAINIALKAAYEAGQQAAQQGVAVDALQPGSQTTGAVGVEHKS